MTATRLIIMVASGMAASVCFISVCIVAADLWSQAASARWWRKRDPLWIGPLSTGAPVLNHGCSDPDTSEHARTGTSHPAKTKPKAHSLKGADRTPVESASDRHPLIRQRAAVERVLVFAAVFIGCSATAFLSFILSK